MSLEVEWDPAKAESISKKHGVSFEEVASVLGDPLSVTLDDPDQSESEPRFLLLGRAATRGRGGADHQCSPHDATRAKSL